MHTLLSVVLILFSLSFLIQLWLYLHVFRKLAFYKEEDHSTEQPPVSVVICARNEEHNLIEHLPRFLSQDYPEYEVVVVNDCSTDNTGDILEEFARKHPHLKIVTIKEDEHYSHGKKMALMIGIKGTRHERLLLTDADCKPAGKDWIRSMMRNYRTETEILLGYGAYERKSGLLNKLIRFDTFIIALQYLSFSLGGKPYMGVGRNLSYKRSVFFRHKGFASHYHIESGDDDLFVNQASTRSNTSICIESDSITYSKPKLSYKSWFRQKRRHITTSGHYHSSAKTNLALLFGSQYAFLTSSVILLISGFHTEWILTMMGMRLASQLYIHSRCMKKLGEKDLLLISPLAEVFLLVLYPYWTISNLFAKEHKWKN